MIPRLKLIRLKHRLTQKELAQRAGVPSWKLSKWEAGIRKPTIVEIALVQRVFKDELFVLNPLEVEEFRKLDKLKCPQNITIKWMTTEKEIS